MGAFALVLDGHRVTQKVRVLGVCAKRLFPSEGSVAGFRGASVWAAGVEVVNASGAVSAGEIVVASLVAWPLEMHRASRRRLVAQHLAPHRSHSQRNDALVFAFEGREVLAGIVSHAQPSQISMQNAPGANGA